MFRCLTWISGNQQVKSEEGEVRRNRDEEEEEWIGDKRQQLKQREQNISVILRRKRVEVRVGIM